MPAAGVREGQIQVTRLQDESGVSGDAANCGRIVAKEAEWQEVQADASNKKG
jgi:hypothetical protein